MYCFIGCYVSCCMSLFFRCFFYCHYIKEYLRLFLTPSAFIFFFNEIVYYFSNLFQIYIWQSCCDFRNLAFWMFLEILQNQRF